jgi:hypothetical protein
VQGIFGRPPIGDRVSNPKNPGDQITIGTGKDEDVKMLKDLAESVKAKDRHRNSLTGVFTKPAVEQNLPTPSSLNSLPISRMRELW